MKYFVLFLLFLLPVSPTLACEGFNNGMEALESAIKQTSKPAKTYASTPPIDSINRSIDKLEKAIEQDRRKKLAQTPPMQPLRF